MNAADTYQRACSRCHGTGGRGVPADRPDAPRPRDFTRPGWQRSVSDNDIRAVVREGRGAMPSFGDVLSESEIDAAVRAVRGFRP